MGRLYIKQEIENPVKILAQHSVIMPYLDENPDNILN